MRRPVFSFRPNMDNPEHRQAWEILQSVPEGQKNQFVVSAILRSREGKYLERIVRQAVREEVQNAVPWTIVKRMDTFLCNLFLRAAA